MIEKLRTLDDIPTNTQIEKNILTICSSYVNKINELVDAVNALVYEHDKDSDWYDGQTRAENVLPDYVTTTYVTNGHTKEYYGQNRASIVTDHPLPAGYVITIRESETKGGNND